MLTNESKGCKADPTLGTALLFVALLGSFQGWVCRNVTNLHQKQLKVLIEFVILLVFHGTYNNIVRLLI